MNGLLLCLNGPMQSWGEHSGFAERDTCRFPTRSGLVGLIAAAEGRRRGERLDDYAPLRFTVRVDRPGVPLVDFHTVGGGYPAHRTPPTADGGRRPAGSGTIVSRRHYLADAAFTVAVTAADSALLDRIARALDRPVWPPFLGRRSCPPALPPLLDVDVDDPVAELRENVPLACEPPRKDDTVDVEFVHEHDSSGGPGGDAAGERGLTELNDVPESFAPRRRTYRTRRVLVERHPLPAALCAGVEGYLPQIAAYRKGRQR